jgi:hypothetical protein
MTTRRFLISFKAPEMTTQPVIAERTEIHGEHLTFFDEKGQLVALFLMEVVESWSESDL